MGLTIINGENIFQKEVIGNVRTAQEDSHDMAAMTLNGDVFVTCDGMGGHVGGKQASSIAVKSVLECLKQGEYSSPATALNTALQHANMQILNFASQNPSLKGMGTTACILMLKEDKAYIAHVGDSRMYMYLGKEKQLHRITKDHSYVQTLVDAGEITDDEAENHPNKNRILKALGIKAELSPTIAQKPILPKNGDLFLLCSDGLSGMISDAVIRDILSKDLTIQQKGDMLIQLALDAGGVDNITLQLIQVCDSRHKRSVFTSFNPTSKYTAQISVKRKKCIANILLCASIAIVVAIAGYLTSMVVSDWMLSKQIDEAHEAHKEIVKNYSKIESELNLKEQKRDSISQNSIKQNFYPDLDEDIKKLKQELLTIDTLKSYNKLSELLNEQTNRKKK